jgi:small-conductance mechanosensitive channel
MLELIQILQEWLTDLIGDHAYTVLATNVALTVFIILVYWVFYALVFRGFRALSRRVLKEDSDVQPLRIQKQEILSAAEVAAILNRTFQVISWVLRIFIIISFLNTVLGLFHWTRDLAKMSTGLIRSAVSGIWQGFVDYIPDLITTLVIIFFAYLLLRLFRLIFMGVQRRRIKIPGFYPEWAKTSFALLRLLIIAMTLVVVFPYLPGSDSPAFQGVTIFIGVLFSLGSTTAVANVVAGIVITFTRAFRTGDQVRISDSEGKVIERTAFVTRILTPKNIEISIPNAAIMSGKVINFSTQAKKAGITLHTGITIGYDVPWPKVQELLLSAATATEHIEEEPKPYVLQTALDDNYVAYELNASTRRADIRSIIYSDLHANILDAFHMAGVEITSPHYRAIRDGNEPAMAPVIPQASADPA